MNRTKGQCSVFPESSATSSNIEASNINETNVVAPTGFGSQASFFQIAFEGLAEYSN